MAHQGGGGSVPPAGPFLALVDLERWQDEEWTPRSGQGHLVKLQLRAGGVEAVHHAQGGLVLYSIDLQRGVIALQRGMAGGGLKGAIELLALHGQHEEPCRTRGRSNPYPGSEVEATLVSISRRSATI